MTKKTWRQINMKLPPEKFEVIRKAACGEGKSMAEFMTDRALDYIEGVKITGQRVSMLPGDITYRSPSSPPCSKCGWPADHSAHQLHPYAPAPSPDPARCHECDLGKTERSPFHAPTCALWCAPSPDPGERPCYPIPGGLPTPEDPWVVGVVASTTTGRSCSKCDQDLALHQADLRCQVGDGEYTRPAPSPAAAPPLGGGEDSDGR